MKLLVPAAYAQFGVGAGRRCGSPRICGGGAPSNGMEDPTLPLWRPAVVHRRTPFVVKRPVYEADCEPAMRCYPALCRERCVQSSLPCVGRVDREVEAPLPPARGSVLILSKPLKFFLQKRIRNGVTLGWKSPRLSHRGAGGIAVRTKWQSGPMTGNIMAQHRTGNRLIGNESCAVGKSYPYLSRKINLRRCPVQYSF